MTGRDLRPQQIERVLAYPAHRSLDLSVARVGRLRGEDDQQPQEVRVAIAAYLGGSGKFDQAVADFAESYADQTERDHAALADAAASGRVQAETGI